MADEKLCCEAGDCEPRICPENKLRLRFKSWTLEAAAMLNEDTGCLYGWQRGILKALLKMTWPRVLVPSWSKVLFDALEAADKKEKERIR